MKKKLFQILTCIAAIAACCFVPEGQIAYAATAEAEFGSDYYTPVMADEFSVGVYIRSDEVVGNYELTLQYDTSVLEYIGGAEREENGIIYLSGSSREDATEVRRMLEFKVLERTYSCVEITGGRIGFSDDNDGTSVKIANDAPIIPLYGAQELALEDLSVEPAAIEAFRGDTYVYQMEVDPNVGELQVSPEAANGIDVSVSDTTLQYGENVITIGLSNRDNEIGEYFLLVDRKSPSVTTPEFSYNGQKWHLVDPESYAADYLKIPYDKVTMNIDGINTTVLCTPSHSVNFAYAVNEKNEVSLFVYNYVTSSFYQCSYLETANDFYYMMPVQAAENLPEGASIDQLSALNVFYAVNSSGESGFYCQDEAGGMMTYQALQESRNSSFEVSGVQIALVVLAVLLLAVGITLLVIYMRERERELKRKRREAAKLAARLERQKEMDDWNIITEEEAEAEVLPEDQPVISVKNVTMEFKVATDSASSLKEHIIRTLQGKTSYRKFAALRDISFDVYEGEVVGIIGTNGSGKSTLLKIVSGALEPTEGTIEVDKSKVQLLTLGTGFDSELTARENVYLNGAIIGYTKEYIDEKYDEIVKFAELEGFMDEKVKNFSSGMVSRLGFAIATMRDTAEILILDEVLSVGDMFFREKSERRIQEMIHGGSTVLIVSHSPGVINKNCTKAVWIERGTLRMVGKPEEVCAAYENMHAEKKKTDKKEKLRTPSLRHVENAINGLMVKWKKVQDADGYYVYRRTKEAKWERIGKTNETRFKDTSALENTEYMYTVRAYKKVGDKVSMSLYDKKGVTGYILPDTLRLQVVRTHNTCVLGRWNYVEGVEGYIIYRKEPGAGWNEIQRVENDVTKCRFVDDSYDGKPYYYTIRSYVRRNDQLILGKCNMDGVPVQ